MKEERIRQLFEGWMNGQLSESEEQEWMQLLVDPTLEDERDRIIGHYYQDLPIGHRMEPEVADALFRKILPAPVRELPQRRRRWGLLAAAVMAGAVVLTGAIWLAGRTKDMGKPVAGNVYKNDVAPGGNHAVLTLAGGATILLDSAADGNLASQGGAKVLKLDAGSLSYQRTAADMAMVYNMLSTPSGGQYQLILSDGTHVWLNALSSIRFPTAFGGSDRTVELTGEAYFEVAKDNKRPFKVHTGGMDVVVLGTSFDVNAYKDEPAIRTTLQQGSVKLVMDGKEMLLHPGQQGETEGPDGLALVKDADVDQALAWMKGFFSFEDADIQMIMRQLSRWYGIEVRYEGLRKKGSFGGKMGRDLSLTQVLTGLSQSGIHFRLEGKQLTVLP